VHADAGVHSHHVRVLLLSTRSISRQKTRAGCSSSPQPRGPWRRQSCRPRTPIVATTDPCETTRLARCCPLDLVPRFAHHRHLHFRLQPRGCAGVGASRTSSYANVATATRRRTRSHAPVWPVTALPDSFIHYSTRSVNGSSQCKTPVGRCTVHRGVVQPKQSPRPTPKSPSDSMGRHGSNPRSFSFPTLRTPSLLLQAGGAIDRERNLPLSRRNPSRIF
jgi:hypothetical protein